MENNELDVYEASISDTAVLRLCRKLYDGKTVLDMRLWGRTKEGKLFPRRNGLCIQAQFYPLVLKLLTEAGVTYNKELKQDGLTT